MVSRLRPKNLLWESYAFALLRILFLPAFAGTVLDGAQVEVTLAKPVDKDTYLRSPKVGRPCSMPAFYVPVDQYGSILPYYPSYFSPPRCTC